MLTERPVCAIISSGDGALLPFIAPQTVFIAHSHGLEHMYPEAKERHSLQTSFGWGHRHLREPVVSFVARRADALIVQTEAQARYARDRYKIRSDTVRVIPNAVEDEFFRILPHGGLRPTVVWIGSWVSGKGTTWLPRLVARLRQLQPDVLVHLVGTGVDRDQVLSAFDPADRGVIKVTMHASRAEVREALSESQVGLFTSVFEGFGRAVVEVMAAGLPLVSTDAGIASQLVVDGQTGRSIRFGEPDSTADAVAYYLSNDGARREHGEAARHAVGSYRWGPVGKQWDHLLRDLI